MTDTNETGERPATGYRTDETGGRTLVKDGAPSPLSQALAATDNKPAKLSPKQHILNIVQAREKDIKRALPDGYVGGAERFARTVLTCVARDPKLLACSPESIIGSAMQAAQLGLTPGVLGEAWLIPRKGECTFMLGYQGLIVLAARSGYRIRAETVYPGDDFEYTLGLEPTLIHRPAPEGRDEETGGLYWYAVARDKSTGQMEAFAVANRAYVNKRRDAGGGASSPAWRDWPNEMALSKAVRKVCKFLPLSVEMSTALASDGVVRTEIAGAAEDYTASYGDDSMVDGEVLT